MNRYLPATLGLFAPALLASAGYAGTITEDWTGTNTDPWPSQWTRQNITATDADASVTIQDNQGEVRLTNNVADARVVNYIDTDNGQNVEQFVEFSVSGSSANSVTAGFVARRLDANNNTFYGVSVGTRTAGNESLQIFKYVDGIETQIAETSDFVARDTNYMMRFRVENGGGGTDLQVKLWLASDPEPTGWTLEILGESTTELQGVDGRFGTWSQVIATDRATTFDNYQATFDPIPEPASLALLGVGGLLIGGVRRRR